MDKGRRHELKMLKYKQRLAKLNIDEKDGNYTAYRSHGKPCSCGICRDEKYSRKQKHKKP